MKTIKKLLFLLLFVSQIITANNLNITNLTKVNDNELSFDISWDNSWNIGGFNDAVWVFIKAKDNASIWRHVSITGIVSSSNFAATLFSKGLRIRRLTTGTGSVSGTVRFNFNNFGLGPLPDFKVFGIEMVHINEGAFYAGDGSGSTNRFHQGDDVNLPYYIQDSNEITVGNTSTDIDKSDLNINIPNTYPTGFDSFYTMKYEITQEQYVEFLNTLTPLQQQNRTESDLSNITSSNRFVLRNVSTPVNRSSIACDSNATNSTPITFYCDLNNNEIPNENNDGQNIACNSISVSDAIAYLDWSAMRPMTDLEFQKAARGTGYPIINANANGTTIAVEPGPGITNSGQPSETPNSVGIDGLIIFKTGLPSRVGSLATNTSTRLQSGGSYYGVMDLSGNLGDYIIRTYDLNLNYTYDFGDGTLDINGNQNAWLNTISVRYVGGSYTTFTTSNDLSISKTGKNQVNLNHPSRFNTNYFMRGCR